MSKKLTFAKAIEEAMKEEMRLDENVLLLGQDVRQGGSWGTSAGILDEFGEERIFPLGINENGFSGMVTGLAMTGKRPIVEFMFGDFMLLAMDAIVDQAAKYVYQSGPEFNIPAVFRLAGSGIGGTFGLHHAQAPDSWLMPFPGIKVVTPATPNDAKGLMKAAIRDNNPVVFIEYKTVYGKMGDIIDTEPIEIGKAKVVREGNDVTVVTYGPGYYKCLGAIEKLEKEGIDVELIDLRTIKPLDMDTIVESITKTGKLVTVEDCCKTACVGSEIAARIAENYIEYLDGPIIRIAGEDTSIPAGRQNETMVVPNENDVINGVKKLL